jgi:hypothetical protein
VNFTNTAAATLRYNFNISVSVLDEPNRKHINNTHNLIIKHLQKYIETFNLSKQGIYNTCITTANAEGHPRAPVSQKRTLSPSASCHRFIVFCYTECRRTIYDKYFDLKCQVVLKSRLYNSEGTRQ